MSARDAFEWFVTNHAGELPDGIGGLVRELRGQLLMLRSEDERGRFVERAVEEISRRIREEEARKGRGRGRAVG